MEGLKTLNGTLCENIKDMLLQKVDQLKTFIETHIDCGNVPTTTTTAEPAQFLLDLYPDATVAYSLRKLKSDYVGNCIKVRRSSDDTTQDIGFYGNVLDESALTTFVGANDGFVHTWYDQSSNGNNAVQTTNANQPRIVSSGVVETEGVKPTINFGTESNEWYFALPTGLLYNATLLSYFHVARIKDYTNSNSGIIGCNGTTGGFNVLQFGSISRRSLLRINGILRNDSAPEANQLWNDDAQTLSSIFGNASSVSAYKNASSVSLTDSSAMPSLNVNGVYYIGTYYSASYDISGNIQEMIIYTSDEVSDRTGIETNINNFYSIY